MATVVNTTPGTSDQSSGIGFMIGAIALLAFLFLLFVYGIPALRNATPAPSQAPAVNVPDQIDVNVDTPQGYQAPQ